MLHYCCFAVILSCRNWNKKQAKYNPTVRWEVYIEENSPLFLFGPQVKNLNSYYSSCENCARWRPLRGTLGLTVHLRASGSSPSVLLWTFTPNVRSVSNIWTVLLSCNVGNVFCIKLTVSLIVFSFQQVFNYWLTSFNMLDQTWLWVLNMFSTVRALVPPVPSKTAPFCVLHNRLLSLQTVSSGYKWVAPVHSILSFSFLFNTDKGENERESKRERQVEFEQTPPRK